MAIKLKEKYCWKILEPFKKQVEDQVKAYMSSLNVLENAMTSAQSNITENPNKNKTTEFNQDLIDLAPMCFSKSDLLESLDNTWFQRTAIVILTFLLPSIIRLFLLKLSSKGCRNCRKEKQPFRSWIFATIRKR